MFDSPLNLDDQHPNVEIWADLFHHYYGLDEYEPHVFFAEVAAPTEMKLVIKSKIIYDFKHYIVILLSMIIEMATKKNDKKIATPLLKPSTIPNSYLLANLSKHLPHFIHLRGISIDNNNIYVSFNNIFDWQAIDSLIMDNFGGYIFNKQTSIEKDKIKAVYYNYNGVNMFSVSKHVITFPYAKIALSCYQKDLYFAFELLAELIGYFHALTPFRTATLIQYYEYVPILKELLRENYITDILGELIGLIISENDDFNKIDPEILKPTRKTKDNLRYIGQVPSHITYIIFNTTSQEVVIGFDSVLSQNEINNKINKQTLLDDTKHCFSKLAISQEKTTASKNYMQFRDGNWQVSQKNFPVNYTAIIDEQNTQLIKISKKSIAFDLSAYKTNKQLILTLVDAIYDKMLFSTNSVHTQELNCALTPVENELLSGINSILHFYRLFAQVRVEKDTYAEHGKFLSSKEWVLDQLRLAGTEDIYKKFLYVLREILVICQEDLETITGSNLENKQAYVQFLSLIQKLERASQAE